MAAAVLAGITLLGAQEGTEQEKPGKTPDERFAEIESRAPGFGGFYRDAGGRLTVRMADMREAAAAEEAVSDLLGPEEVARSGGLRLIPGDYTFSQLAGWKRQALTVHTIPGVSLTDVDEAANRVRIGIETEQTRGAVEQELDRLGIPREAADIVVTGPFGFMASVDQDAFRPLIGGTQITFDCDTMFCSVCTDGFVVRRGDARGFVTNSHCTHRPGGVQDTAYFQPAPGVGLPSTIGVERADPRFKAIAGCPGGRTCRRSDSAFVKRRKKVQVSQGLIARPDSIGSLNMASASQTFRITDEAAGSMVGDLLNKVGRTTGWSQGDVLQTCVDVDVSGTGFTLLCQDIVGAGVGGGDSGSPVFKITGGNDVTLFGILWGGNEGGTQFVFSPLSNIEAELGRLMSCDPLIGC